MWVNVCWIIGRSPIGSWRPLHCTFHFRFQKSNGSPPRNADNVPCLQLRKDPVTRRRYACEPTFPVLVLPMFHGMDERDHAERSFFSAQFELGGWFPIAAGIEGTPTDTRE